MQKSSATAVLSLLAVLTLTLIPNLAVLEAADAPTQPSSILAATGMAWELLTPSGAATMYALDMLDETEGWAGGPEGFFLHYDGNTWNNFPTSFRRVTNGISMVSETSGWAVTHQGDMLRFNGTSWSVHSTPGTSYLKDVKMLSETEGWAVGGVGTNGQSIILRYNAGGNEWVPVSNPGVSTLQAIDMVNSSDGWAVGVGLTLLHWNGSTWVGGGLGPGILWDVDMLSSTDGWAVGSDGVIYHYSGSSWAQVTSPTSADLRGVSMTSATNGWAVGGGGTILHYDGVDWQVAGSPTTQTLFAIEMVPPNHGWAVGYGGIVLQAIPDLSPSNGMVNPRHASAGERLTYTISVQNSGAGAATGVVVTDETPANTTFVPGSATTSKGTIQSTDPLVVNVGDVSPDEQVTISFQVDVQDPGQQCWFVVNDTLIDSDSQNLTRRATTTVGDCYQDYAPLLLKNFQ